MLVIKGIRKSLTLVILIIKHKFVWFFSKADYVLKLVNLPGVILIAPNNSK